MAAEKVTRLHDREDATARTERAVPKGDAAATERPSPRMLSALDFERGLADGHVTHQDAADVLDVGRTVVDGLCRGEKPITGERLYRLADDPRTSKAVQLFADKLKRRATRTTAPALDPRTDVCRLSARMGQLATTVNVALADGHESDAESAAIDRDLEGVIRLAEEILAARAQRRRS